MWARHDGEECSLTKLKRHSVLDVVLFRVTLITSLLCHDLVRIRRKWAKSALGPSWEEEAEVEVALRVARIYIGSLGGAASGDSCKNEYLQGSCGYPVAKMEVTVLMHEPGGSVISAAGKTVLRRLGATLKRQGAETTPGQVALRVDVTSEPDN